MFLLLEMEKQLFKKIKSARKRNYDPTYSNLTK